MKKSMTRRLLAMCLCLTLVSISLVGGTLAKYTSTVSGTDTATVAKFAFSVKDGDSMDYKTSAATVNLFGTDKKIAPGEEGSFVIKLSNAGSEVAVQFTSDVTLPETQDGLTIAYAVADSKPTAATGYTLTTAENLESALNTAMGTMAVNATEKTVNVYWCWVDNNTADANQKQTVLATSTTAVTYPVTIAITGTQSDVTNA